MSQRVNKEKVKIAIATSGTIIATAVVVTSMVHSFVCSEEKQCFACRKIQQFKDSRKVQKQIEEEIQEEEKAQEMPVQTVSGKVIIGQVDIQDEMKNLENVDE